MTEMEERLMAKMREDKADTDKKLKGLSTLVKEVEADRSTTIERIVVKAVRAEAREKRFTRNVRKSTEDLDAATSRNVEFSFEKSEERFKAEEARVVANLRQDAENLQAVQQVARSLRSRRRARPEAPRPLVRREPHVVNLEEEAGSNVTEVVELE